MRYKKFIIALILIIGLIFAFYVSFPSNVAQVPMVENRIAVLDLSGIIAYSESPLTLWGETLTPDEVSKMVKQVEDDPATKAVLLKINSPGGSAAASEEIYQIIENLAKKKTVVAYLTEYGASGGYYIALPAKEIIANPSVLTGSIGAVNVIVNFEGLFKKLGIKAYIFKSNEFKDIGSPYRNITSKEIEVLQSIIDNVYHQFQAKVIEHRGVKISYDEVFSGRPFTGVQAKSVGLVDDVGTFEHALNVTKKLAGLPLDTPYYVVEKPKPSLLDLLLGGTRGRLKLSYEVLLMWPLPADLEVADVIYLLKTNG